MAARRPGSPWAGRAGDNLCYAAGNPGRGLVPVQVINLHPTGIGMDTVDNGFKYHTVFTRPVIENLLPLTGKAQVFCAGDEFVVGPETKFFWFAPAAYCDQCGHGSRSGIRKISYRDSVHSSDAGSRGRTIAGG